MTPRPLRTRPGLTANVQSLTVGDHIPPAPSQTPAVTDSGTPALPHVGSSEARHSQPPAADAGAAEEPLWRRLVRKEARLRADQAEALSRLRRQITRTRSTRDEVITDNTLIRVAVDLLLSRIDDLTGDTEDQLRSSLHLPPTP